MSDSLEYSSGIDNKINEAVKDVLFENVESFERLTHGEQNYVYKVKTQDNTYILRVFRSRDWPEESKPLWIESQFKTYNIPHAKTLFQTRNAKHFKFGFMISEFIDGVNGEEAIKTGLISFEDFHIKLFELLSKIHAISIKKFGLINAGEGEFETYQQYRFQDFQEYKTDILTIPDFDISLLNKAEGIISSSYKDISEYPVLVHGDPTPDNSILTKDGQVILVDWDDARAGWWFDDMAWLIYCGSHISESGTLKERKELFYKLSPELQNQNRQKLEDFQKVFDLSKQVGLIRYYYFSQKNIEEYENTLARLTETLKEF